MYVYIHWTWAQQVYHIYIKQWKSKKPPGPSIRPSWYQSSSHWHASFEKSWNEYLPFTLHIHMYYITHMYEKKYVYIYICMCMHTLPESKSAHLLAYTMTQKANIGDVQFYISAVTWTLRFLHLRSYLMPSHEFPSMLPFSKSDCFQHPAPPGMFVKTL